MRNDSGGGRAVRASTDDTFRHAAPLGARDGRRARVALHRENERDHRRKAKEKLAALRAHLRAARLERKNALDATAARCRSEREAVRERAKMTRLRALEELRQALHAERLAARGTCSVAKDEARRKTIGAVEKARAELEAERKYQEDLQRIERNNRVRVRERVKRSSVAERRSESDDEVRANLPDDLIALFEKVKRGIRVGPRQSRTEAFLKYAEEHPHEVLATLDDKTEQVIRDLERREREATRMARRRRYTAAELAEVPF